MGRTLPLYNDEPLRIEKIRPIMQMVAPWDTPSIMAITFNTNHTPRRVFCIRGGKHDDIERCLNPIALRDPDAEYVAVGAAPTFCLTIHPVR